MVRASRATNWVLFRIVKREREEGVKESLSTTLEAVIDVREAQVSSLLMRLP